jgi:hypothetical protein
MQPPLVNAGRNSGMPTFADEKLGYSISGFAAASGLGVTTIYRLIAEGRLEARHFGTRRVILAESARRLMAEGAPAQPRHPPVRRGPRGPRRRPGTHEPPAAA